MKKLVLLGVIFLFAFVIFYKNREVHAATTITAASCNQADVQSAVNQAVDGDTVNVPAGNCTWTATVTITKGISVIGAGSSSTTIQHGSGNQLFTVSLSSATAPAARISGMSLVPTTGSGGQYAVASFNGTCNSATCSHIRADHLSMTGWSYGSGQFTGYLMKTDNVFGVLDHNTVSIDYGIWVNINHSNYGGVGDYGDNSWAQPDTIGTDNALYVEDNIISPTSEMAVTDADNGGGRFVGRFNTITNGSFQTHGTESPGRNRGGRQFEVYNNTLTITGTHMEDMLAMRSGTAMAFNNTINSPIGQFRGDVSMSAYRIGNTFAPWGFCGSDLSPWDQADGGGTYATGTITSLSVSGATLTVTDTSKSNLATYADPSNTYFIVDTSVSSHPAAEIEQATSNSVTSNNWAYWGPQVAWNVGDTYIIRRVNYCLDQPGTGGPGTLISGATPSVTSFPDILRPIYEWGSTLNQGTPGNGWVYPNWNAKLVADKNYYKQNANFNGTSGTGTGTWAARPTTCTNGVGYWVTDRGGNWNTINSSSNDGALYVCTNSGGADAPWSLYYTPYTYPHPLTAGTVTATPLAGDLNLDHIVNSLDWSIMNSKWFTSDSTADLNHDGVVNSLDWSIMNSNWFKTW